MLEFIGANVWVVFYLMTLVIYFAAFWWGVKTIFGFTRSVGRLWKHLTVDLPMKRRSSMFISGARALGTILVCNTQDGITAVVAASDFYHELSLFNGSHGRERTAREQVSPVRVMPTRIYTFADEEEGYEFVTGTTRDKINLLNNLIFDATGYRPSEVSSGAWKEAERILVRKDRRLMVPFIREGRLSNGRRLPSLEDQCELFGSFTLEVAEADFKASAIRGIK